MSNAVALVGGDRLGKLAEQIRASHLCAVEHAGQVVAHAVEAGLLLLEAKELVGHGEWGEWLKANCGFADRTARLYMQVASNRDALDSKRQRVADLTLRAAVKQISKPKPKAFAAPVETEAEPVETETCTRVPDAGTACEREAMPDPDGSWGVEAVSLDGRAWRSGIRLATRKEAETYIECFVSYEVQGYALAVIFKSDDTVHNSIRSRYGKERLSFDEGTCFRLDWKPVNPCAETIETVRAKAAEWNNLVAKLERKAKACNDPRQIDLEDAIRAARR